METQTVNILSNLPVAIVLVDAEGKIVYASSEFTRLTGHAGPLEGMGLTTLNRKFFRGTLTARVLRRMVARGGGTMVANLAMADGGTWPVQVTVYPLRENGSTLTGLLLLVEDVAGPPAWKKVAHGA